MIAAALTEVTRRDVVSGREVVESVHAGHLVVAASDGSLLVGLGDADATVFVRSAAKPFQATACLEVLGEQADAVSDAEVAVAWASHRAEPRHLAQVRRLLARSRTPAAALSCTPAVGEADPGAVPAALTNNCSGKHALFALAGRVLGVSGPELLAPDEAVQRRVLGVLAEVLGPVRAIGTDGCGAPAVAVPLTALAVGYGRLAVDGRWARVRTAGLACPGLVGGHGRLESALLAAGVVAKVGAEGVYGVGWTASDGTGRGLAVKAADGSARGAAQAVVSVVEALGVVPPGTWVSPPPLGGGRPAGVVRCAPPMAELVAALNRDGVTGVHNLR